MSFWGSSRYATRRLCAIAIPSMSAHEGELTAAKRLIDSLHKIYGGFIDAFVGDDPAHQLRLRRLPGSQEGKGRTVQRSTPALGDRGAVRELRRCGAERTGGFLGHRQYRDTGYLPRKSPRGPRRGDQAGPRETNHLVLRRHRPACAPDQSSNGATDHPVPLAYRGHRVPSMDQLLLVRDTNAHLAFSVSLFASPEQHGLYTKWGKQLVVSGSGKK